MRAWIYGHCTMDSSAGFWCRLTKYMYMDVFIQIATMVKISDTLSLSSRTHLLKIADAGFMLYRKERKVCRPIIMLQMGQS